MRFTVPTLYAASPFVILATLRASIPKTSITSGADTFSAVPATVTICVANVDVLHFWFNLAWRANVTSPALEALAPVALALIVMCLLCAMSMVAETVV